MKVGFTAGTFDLLHTGHVLMLEECSSKCDHLIVGLHTNPHIERPHKNPPVQSLVERYIQLKAVKFVSEIIPYQTEKDLVDLLTILPIDIRFIGSDWEGKDFTGKNLGEKKHKILYNRREHPYSSSDLRKRIKDKK